MNCASCGQDNVDDARYCAHCGASQSVPTPIAAVAAAAMSRGAARSPAANAAHAEPLASATGAQRTSAPGVTHAAPAAWPRSGVDEPVEGAASGGAPASSSPAYGGLPRQGLVALLAGGFILVGIFVFVGWRVLHDGSGADTAGDKAAGDTSIMSAFPPENTPHRTPSAAAVAPPPLPATPAAESALNPQRPAAGAASAKADEAASLRGDAAAAASDHTPPVEIKALPARPAHPAQRRAAVERKTSPPAPVAAAPAPEPAPARAAASPAPPAAPAPPPDRWSRMREELSRCTREDFIARVICDQRVRWRYCDGYWGKVVQCPANPTTPERGQ